MKTNPQIPLILIIRIVSNFAQRIIALRTVLSILLPPNWLHQTTFASEHTNTTNVVSTIFALENIQTTNGSEEHNQEILFTYTSRTAECSIMKFKDANQFIEVAKFCPIVGICAKKLRVPWMELKVI